MIWIFFVLIVVYFMYNFLHRKNTHGVQGKRKINIIARGIAQKLNEHQVHIENITLNKEQKALFDEIEKSNNHFFITGEAGTGKSVLLQYLKYKSEKTLVVGAFTGVAALNVGGQTLHSLFQLPTGFIDTAELRIGSKVATLLRHVDTLIIDEVSMVRADMIDGIDVLLRQAHKNDIPFGGVQIIMFGDPYQLPPIADKGLLQYFAHNNGGHYFFNANVFKKLQLNAFELVHNHRQEADEEFRLILNAVRKNKMEDGFLTKLNSRSVVEVPRDGVITLAPKNDTVTYINSTRLAELNEKLYEYKASISGNLEQSAFPAEELLRLKKGAQVMLLKNDPNKRWVNGTIGIVESLSLNEIKVNIDGISYSIPRSTWKKIRYQYDLETRKITEEVMSSFTQFPLGLAWAFTIHKSQGKTYDSVIVDMEGGAFAHGQTYVALSRCRRLSGLYLTQPISKEDIKVDPIVAKFMESIKMCDIVEDDQAPNN